jgi:hypothetical protein
MADFLFAVKVIRVPVPMSAFGGKAEALAEDDPESLARREAFEQALIHCRHSRPFSRVMLSSPSPVP